MVGTLEWERPLKGALRWMGSKTHAPAHDHTQKSILEEKIIEDFIFTFLNQN